MRFFVFFLKKDKLFQTLLSFSIQDMYISFRKTCQTTDIGLFEIISRFPRKENYYTILQPDFTAPPK